MTRKNDLSGPIIGNCTTAAILNDTGDIIWGCYPHFDSDPIFCRLLDSDTEDKPTGFWAIDLIDFSHAEQSYRRNTAIVETILYDQHGGAIKITDFMPRYRHYGRYYRPSKFVRQIEPLSGRPRVIIRLRPKFDYNATRPQVTQGSNHVRYVGSDKVVRLTTDMPISYITQETPFILNETQTMILGADDPVRDDVAITGQRLLSQTDHYWQHDFTRSLALPFEWQRAVIRAAITLKLCTFEETGAVLAAPTTSIPEHAGSQRNWDYRYCWLRDSYFVIEALNRLGATRTMEGYIDFILNATALDLDTDKNGAKDIQPLYGISMERDLIETEAEHLSGYRGMGPVRIGNKAYEQDQHDVYGSLILASMQSFFDERLHRIANIEDFYRLEQIGELAAKKYDQPDAGIWEFRGISRVHTFSAVMCWTACERLSRIAKHLDLHDRADHWRNTADDMHAEIMDRAWNEEINSFSESFGGSDLDASLLLLHELDFITPEDAKFIATVEAIEQNLMKNGLLFRYVREDDFGEPDTAFTICTFWFIDALHAIGRHQDARQMFERMLELRNPVGLLSEDLDFKTHELWGNFPQTYSMVGLINSAMRLSKEWTDMI